VNPILIVEDEAALAQALALAVQRLGHRARTAASAAAGLAAVAAEAPALVILDIGLPDQNGLDTLAALRKLLPELPVLVITAHGNLQNAVLAKQRGAAAYLVKPLDLRELQATVQGLLQATAAPAPAVGAAPAHDPAPLLIGSAPAMQPAFAAIAHACASEAPVLIAGPTGIGKSLCAQVIHLHSARARGPFVALHCASLPEALLEAELFGHERGAFTGAAETRIGHLERAAGGTLLLDEIGDVPLALQTKLLRVVEERTFVRVGGREDRRIDVRVLAATHHDLPQRVREGRFREDLYYRLRVLEVRLPPLAARLEDLPALCSYLLANRSGAQRPQLSADALAVLQRHTWPGNVRELRNALEHAAAVCSGPLILEQHLPAELRAAAAGPAGQGPAGGLGAALRPWVAAQLPFGSDYETLHGQLEAELLAALLPHFGGRPTLLARQLGMHRATLRKKLRAYGLASTPEPELLDPDGKEPPPQDDEPSPP
jgi:DNA-binding NtrC family response regulator